jgi:hypothetical protein
MGRRSPAARDRIGSREFAASPSRHADHELLHELGGEVPRHHGARIVGSRRGAFRAY